MKKIEKMIHQIIRFRGNIEAFLVSIEEFSRSSQDPNVYCCIMNTVVHSVCSVTLTTTGVMV